MEQKTATNEAFVQSWKAVMWITIFSTSSRVHQPVKENIWKHHLNDGGGCSVRPDYHPQPSLKGTERPQLLPTEQKMLFMGQRGFSVTFFVLPNTHETESYKYFFV